MKNLLLLATTMLIGSACSQTKTDKPDPEIVKTVKAFSLAGDVNNAAALEKLLHDQHRLVWNDGEKAPFILGKEGYVSKIESKEWGGDKRTITIESVESYDGVNATVKAVLDGEKSQMRSLFSLIKVEGSWKIVQEVVNATFKG